MNTPVIYLTYIGYYRGHIRPLCAFVARIVQMHQVYVTFLIAGDNVARVQAEISKYLFAPEHRMLLTLIRFGLHNLPHFAIYHSSVL